MEKSQLMDWERAVTEEVCRDPKELERFSATERIITHHVILLQPLQPPAGFVSRVLARESRNDLQIRIFRKIAKRIEKIAHLFREFHSIRFVEQGWYIKQAGKEAFLDEVIELLTFDRPAFFESAKSLSDKILLTKEIAQKIECFVCFAQPTRRHNGWYFPTRETLDQFISAIIEILLEEPYKAEFSADYAIRISQREIIRRVAIAMVENRIGIKD